MGMVRNLARRVLAGVGRAVHRDDLFEQPSERPPTERLPRRPKPAAEEAPEPAAPATSKPSPAPAKKKAGSGRGAAAPKGGAGARPAEGCAPADDAALLAALAPSGRPLVINHWATWCDPCVEELPRLVRAHAAAGEEADFIGVSWDLFDHPGDARKRAVDVARFADGVGVGYPSVLYTGEPARLFELCGLDWELIPQTVVLSPTGVVVYHHKGVLGDDDVPALLAAARGAGA